MLSIVLLKPSLCYPTILLGDARLSHKSGQPPRDRTKKQSGRQFAVAKKKQHVQPNHRHARVISFLPSLLRLRR